MPGSIIGAGIGLLGADKAASEAKKSRKLQKKQMDRLAQVEFNPFGTSFNGAGVDFSNGQANLNMGGFQGQFGQFGQNAQQFAGNQPALQSIFNQSASRVNDRFNPFQQGLQDSFFGGAQQFANRANQGFDSLRDETLGALRAQAQPFEDRAFTGMLDNQFSTGRLGSSGGALQTEAFARGLGQADLDRQLAATGQAQQLQSQQANLAQMFGQAGGQTAATGDALLQSAMNQFGQSQGMLGQNQANQAGALSGQNSIMQMLLGLGTFGGNLGAQQASTGIAAAGGAGQIAGQMANNLGPGDIQGQFLQQMGNNFSSGGNPFAGMFGGGSMPNQPTPLFNNTAQFVSGDNNA